LAAFLPAVPQQELRKNDSSATRWHVYVGYPSNDEDKVPSPATLMRRHSHIVAVKLPQLDS